MSDGLMVNEIFYSLQGEGTRAGRPCAFVRLMGCHLRCGYCDTEYAFYEGRRWGVDDVLAEVQRVAGDCELVQVTGGEPLLQPNVHELMGRLADAGRTVMVETSGACDIGACDERVIRIMDLKTPGSGEAHRNHWPNIEHLNERDEVKFVVCGEEDYKWARRMIEAYALPDRVGAVLLSAVHEMPRGRELPGAAGVSLGDLAAWVLRDGLKVQVQTQLHKLIWDPMARGV